MRCCQINYHGRVASRVISSSSIRWTVVMIASFAAGVSVHVTMYTVARLIISKNMFYYLELSSLRYY